MVGCYIITKDKIAQQKQGMNGNNVVLFIAGLQAGSLVTLTL